jgi:hypothetical protein
MIGFYLIRLIDLKTAILLIEYFMSAFIDCFSILPLRFVTGLMNEFSINTKVAEIEQNGGK